jgi:signal transduction histidine kinase/AraC-like DNA-binding protein/ABC-type sugar transport system substrate-binding protein
MTNDDPQRRLRIGVLAGWQVYGGTLDTFLSPMFRGILSAGMDRGCDVFLACGVGLPRDVGLGRPAWPVLLPEADFVPVGPWNVDGLIVLPPLAFDSGSRYFQQLLADGYPLVFVGAGEQGPSVVVDNEGGIRQAVAHLVEHGHRRIAFIAGHESRPQGDSGQRLRAYEAALRERDLYDPALIAHGYHVYAGGRRAMEQILQAGTPFTAVLASNDESAHGALEVLKARGLVVPQDVALVGFDDRLEARAAVPSLTTVRMPMYHLGQRAVDLVLDYIKGTENTQRIVRVPTRLVVRDSCGCLSGTPDQVESQIPLSSIAIRSGSATQEGQGASEARRRMTELLIGAISAETHQLNAEEIEHLCGRLLDALLSGLEQRSSDVFLEVMQQILHRVASVGDDPHVWQGTVSVLQDNLPAILEMSSQPLRRSRAEALLDRARVAISQAVWEQHMQCMFHHADIAYRLGQMNARLHGARDEAEIYDVIAEDLLRVGIRHTSVAFYEPEGDDPVAWSALQASTSAYSGPGRFATRAFPPPGLYPAREPLSIAMLPLTVQDELRGYVAFDTGNLQICGDVARQLAAALRGVWLYRQAVEGQRLAEEANHLKSRFLSMVSHELRTPLNLIAGLSELLLREGEGEAPEAYEPERKDIQRIYANAQHLDGLIRDVLDLAQSEVGQLKLVREPLDLSEVLATVATIGEQLAHDKGLSWRVEIPSDLPRVWGDRTRLRQVMLNLVNNAVKFTTQGGVLLSAAVEAPWVTMVVQDTGLGIPVEEQQLIFDEFRQSNRTATRGYGGLGLGLAICKRLVEMHDGEISVQSSGQEDSGSIFTVKIPVLAEQRARARMKVPLVQGERIVLLVQDAEAGSPFREHLLHRGFDVDLYAANGKGEWLSWLLDALPVAVVLDLELASEQGWDVIKLLKENPATRDIPVLFATIADDQGTGAIVEMEYLTKPMGSVELCDALLRQGLACGDPGQGQAVLIVDDEPGVLEMHARIVQSQLPGCRVLRAGNGRDALQVVWQERPDLVLLDLMMPELDGFGVLEAMQEHEMSRHIPVIVLTGQVLTREDMARLNQGVVRVLDKGVLSVEETLAHIEAALSRAGQSGPESQQIARRAMACIHEHYAEPILRADVAANVGVSERHLARCLKEELGMTVSTYLNRYRVRQAKQLLAAGDMNVTEVAMAVGFSSSGYFSQVFRQEAGVSPSAYQRGER